MENEFNIQEYLADGVEYIVKNAMKATLFTQIFETCPKGHWNQAGL